MDGYTHANFLYHTYTHTALYIDIDMHIHMHFLIHCWYLSTRDIRIYSLKIWNKVPQCIRDWSYRGISNGMKYVNSQWPSEAKIMATEIWVNMDQVMACCLTAKTITRTNVDWSSDIHIRAISHEMPHPSLGKIHLKLYILNLIQMSKGSMS